MLEIRPTCENYNKPLPFDVEYAMICTFKCTFCTDCVERLKHVCPDCGGGFEKQSIRPKNLLQKYPVSTEVVHKPLDFEVLFERL